MSSASRRPLFLRALLLALVGVAALLALGPVRADVRKLAPGKSVALGPGEGLLLVAIDTSTELEYLKIRREGTLFDGSTLWSLPKGRTSQLYVVPAGRYRWEAVKQSWQRFKVGDDEGFGFDVKPGVINYPGDLVYRPNGPYDALMHVANRGLLAIDWLEQQHPAIARDVPMTYVGHYPDPFPSMYQQAAGRAKPAADRTLAVPPGGSVPIAIDELWRPSRLAIVSMNPAGDLVGVVSREKQGERWTWSTSILDLRRETVQEVLQSTRPIGRIDWSGNRALVVSEGDSGEPDVVYIVRGEEVADNEIRYVRLTVPRLGLLIDPLPGDPDHVLFASLQTGTSRYNVQVHKLDISSQQALDDFQFSMRNALDHGVRDDVNWFADGQGRLRLAMVLKEDGIVVMHERNGSFHEVPALADRALFTPLALSADGNIVHGWTDKDREQRDLVEFDLLAGRIGRTLFSRPGTDVQDALFDGQRNLIGATYFDGGQLVSHYFDDATLQARLQRSFPGQSVSILDRDAQARQFLLLVGGSDQPSVVYHFDLAANRASLLEQTRPWLAGVRFQPAHLIRARSRDGLAIEAYLTLPGSTRPGAEYGSKESGKVPVVVLPHGGPVGVRDSRYFNPEVQFLSALGYAVLQVNFRGSDGYGKAFREAGQRSQGSLIEDDIDAALAAALAGYPLDATRMCAMGSSYGGYSAMVSAIRWPGRFKCVVSIAGISDRVLFFTASDASRSEDGRKALEEVVGDPRLQLEEMLRSSPLYRHGALSLPLMLVHGTEDFRVDYEHSRRLLRMLNLDNRPPVLITLEEEGHGIEKAENIRKVWEGVAGFLRANLGAGAATPVGGTQP